MNNQDSRCATPVTEAHAFPKESTTQSCETTAHEPRRPEKADAETQRPDAKDGRFNPPVKASRELGRNKRLPTARRVQAPLGERRGRKLHAVLLHSATAFENLPNRHVVKSAKVKAAAAAAAKWLQSCPTPSDAIEGSPPGSLIQARILEWVAISFSNGGK